MGTNMGKMGTKIIPKCIVFAPKVTRRRGSSFKFALCCSMLMHKVGKQPLTPSSGIFPPGMGHICDMANTL